MGSVRGSVMVHNPVKCAHNLEHLWCGICEDCVLLSERDVRLNLSKNILYMKPKFIV